MSTCSTSSCGCSTTGQAVAPAQTSSQGTPAGVTRPGALFHPQCDAYIAGDEAVIVADMPGCRAETIDVTFDRGVLTIRGPVEARRPSNPDQILLDEYTVGDYYRTFRVEFPVDAAAISAEYKHGVLTVRVPKHAAARERRVPVATGA